MELVDHSHLEPVTPIGFELWSWVLSVDQKADLAVALWGNGAVCDFESVFHSFASVGPCCLNIGIDVETWRPVTTMAGAVWQVWVVFGVLRGRY